MLKTDVFEDTCVHVILVRGLEMSLYSEGCILKQATSNVWPEDGSLFFPDRYLS